MFLNILKPKKTTLHSECRKLEISILPKHSKKDSTFYTTTKTLGKYALVSDTHKPKASVLYFKNNDWISKRETIKVKISDNGSGIKNYRATLDGEWVLMEYNHKKRILTYNFSDKNWLVANISLKL